MVAMLRAIAFALNEGFGPRGYAFGSGVSTLPGGGLIACPLGDPAVLACASAQVL